jgi:hypothetical protein
MKMTIGAVALVLAAALPARAQEQHGHGQMHGDAQAHSQMMMQMHRAHAAVEHGQEIGVSADQSRRLAAVDSAQTAAMRQHCREVQAAGGPSAQTHAAMHPQMMAQVEGFSSQVNAILTQPQKARLDSLMAAHHGAMAGHDMAAMHQQHGASAAQHDSAHAAHQGAGGQHEGEHAPDCCTDEDCCKMMGCDEHQGSEHGEHHGAGHSNG